MHGAKLVLGVDRLDYSKGLANSMRAFDRMLELEPTLKRAVSLLQVAVPSRGNIKAYRELKAELAALVGEVNGRHGEVDWTPIRYLNKGFSQLTLAGFYRVAGVGLVTPLHDGMNLVAKEYVAAQNPFDPGVLVLSSFAGAAKELDAALLVNPHDIDGMARQIAAALHMSVEERRERWQSMVRKLKAASVQSWFADFLHTLADVRRTPLQAATRPIVLELASRRAAQGRSAKPCRSCPAGAGHAAKPYPAGSRHKEIFTLFRHSRPTLFVWCGVAWSSAMSGTRHFIAEILPRVVRLPLPSQSARRRLFAATVALAGLILLPVARAKRRQDRGQARPIFRARMSI